MFLSQRGKWLFVCLLTSLAGGWFPAQSSVAAQSRTPAPSRVSNAIQKACLQSARYCNGVRNTPGERRLSASQLNQVLQRLREQTGWSGLYFNEAGFLVCPDPQAFSGGSAAARRLLGAALLGNQAYDLEAHNGSLAVSFARLTQGIDHEDAKTGAKINARPVEIDFTDFQQLRGDGAVIKAFDVGFVVLHELAHGVWQLRDAAVGEEEPGECESYINQIRRELQLPERQHYNARAHFCTTHRTRLMAELYFIRTREKSGQTQKKRFLLYWDAEAVGSPNDYPRAKKPNLTADVR
jgi:hypothetical protein